MSSIALTSGMKSALLSLQSTQKLYDKTQERLTSGEKVSSPSDDPAAYYAASTLYDQADALEGRLDNMEQAVEAISAADNGIESMISALSSMTAIVESALATDSSDTDTRAALGKKFNDLLIQLSTLADDSAYGGQNLLADQDITVQMGASYNDSTFTVEGFYVAGLTQVDTDDDGEVSSILSGSIPSEWGDGAVEASNYAFALNLVEDPTSIVGIQSYGVPDDTAEATAANENLSTIASDLAAALAADVSDLASGSSTAAADIMANIADAMSAANAITGTTGSFSFSTVDGAYVYSGTADDGTDGVLAALNAMYDLYTSVSDTESAFASLSTAYAALPSNSSLDEMKTYITNALNVDMTDPDTAAATIQTQTSYAMSEANTQISSLINSNTSLAYTGQFEYDNDTTSPTYGTYIYNGTDDDSTTDAIAASLNAMLTLQGAVSDVASAQDALTTQETSFDEISPSDFGITETTSDSWELDWTDADTYTDSLSTVLEQIEAVQAVLETRSKLLSFDESTISMRQDYTEEFINTLEEGADDLTLADLNEESANLLSLETSQSLAVQAMSLANEQMQNVLRLLQ